jgi:FAD/FMN-containing dehydrogenase
VAISRELSATLRSRFGAQLLQENPRIVIAVTKQEMIQDAIEIARKEHLKVLPLGTGSSFPANYSRLNENTIAVLMGTLDGECGGDAFSSWYWAGTRIRRVAANFPGVFPENAQRVTLGGFVAGQPMASTDPTLHLLQAQVLSVEVLMATGEFELFAGEGTGTVYSLPSCHLLFGSRGNLGVIVRIRLRRHLGPDAATPQSAGSFGASLIPSGNQTVLARSQLQALVDPGGLFAWKKEW